jgi:hypothetical protein
MRVDAAGVDVATGTDTDAGICDIGIDGYKLEATAGAEYDTALGAVFDFTKPNVCMGGVRIEPYEACFRSHRCSRKTTPCNSSGAAIHIGYGGSCGSVGFFAHRAGFYDFVDFDGFSAHRAGFDDFVGFFGFCGFVDSDFPMRQRHLCFPQKLCQDLERPRPWLSYRRTASASRALPTRTFC